MYLKKYVIGSREFCWQWNTWMFGNDLNTSLRYLTNLKIFCQYCTQFLLCVKCILSKSSNIQFVYYTQKYNGQ